MAASACEGEGQILRQPVRATPFRQAPASIATAALWLVLATGAAATDRVELPSPGSDAWQPLELPRVRQPTRYAPERVGDLETVRAESNCSASGLVLALDDVDLERTPLLHWRWRVDRGLDIDDERTRDGDDFAARVYVMFRFDGERQSMLSRLRHRLAGVIHGRETPGTALNFVWTSRIEPGTHWDNPFDEHNRMIARARGGHGTWRSETVDVVAGYRDAFGFEPPALMGIAVMTDSDNSCQRAEAHFADFAFLSHRARESSDDD